MKHLSIISLVVSLLLGFFCFQLWQQSSDLATRMQALEKQNEQLAAELKASQDEMGFIREKLLEFERTSLKGIADQANDAFLEGWESLIGIVGKEIDQARKNIEQQRRSTPNSNQQGKTPGSGNGGSAQRDNGITENPKET
ncbi:hypothetical protein [Pseudoteredinibacter isoporae]|uniref:hypothetical protein n=1 Tax=Pseudoteredinibacter isoporae TaxID=570281 RepID=UPI00310ABD8B